MKKIFFIYFIVIFILLSGISYLGFHVKKIINDFKISSYLNDKKEENKEKIKEKEKELIRKGLETAQENIEDKIYKETIEYDSEGNLLPDNVDDTIKEKIDNKNN